jgi:hypothetical protein
MNNYEDRLAEMLRRRSADVDDSSLRAHQVVRRARTRRTLTMSTLVVGVLAVAFTGVGLSRIEHHDQKPAVPGETSPYPGHPGPFTTGDNPKTGRVEFARGERRGLIWKLWLRKSNYRLDKHGPRGEYCTWLEWDGGGGSCPARLPKSSYLSIRRESSAGSEDAVTGDIDRDVARVEIRLNGYGPFDVPIIEGPAINPPEEDPRVNYFLAFIPVDSTGTVAVFDRSGTELQVEPIRAFRDFPDPDELDLDPAPDGSARCIDMHVTITGTDKSETLRGTDGPDVVAGLGGDDTILGLGGNDTVCGGDGNDSISGGSGGDELSGGPGDDELRGGDGFDSIAFWQSPSGVVVDLEAGTAIGDGSDDVSGFESLGGSDYDDRLTGTDGPDQIDAGYGEDVLRGLGGDDILYGGEGDDEYAGGDGRDLVSFSFAEQGVEVNLLEGYALGEGDDLVSGVEIIDGTRFKDSITGGDADELLMGREGDDFLSGESGDDVLWGEFSGMSAASYRRGGMLVEHASDILVGGPGTDELHGGPGRNTCSEGERLEDCDTGGG